MLIFSYPRILEYHYIFCLVALVLVVDVIGTYQQHHQQFCFSLHPSEISPQNTPTSAPFLILLVYQDFTGLAT